MDIIHQCSNLRWIISMRSKERICRVCGLSGEGLFWESSDSPSYSICPCCGNEAGVNDFYAEGVIGVRKCWEERGFKPEFSDFLPGPNWSPHDQMKNLDNKKLNEILLEFVYSNKYDPYKFGWIKYEAIQTRDLLHGVIRLIDDDRLVNASQDLICDLLQEIERSRYPITPEQRAILERHASPSPPQNFSP